MLGMPGAMPQQAAAAADRFLKAEVWHSLRKPTPCRPVYVKMNESRHSAPTVMSFLRKQVP